MTNRIPFIAANWKMNGPPQGWDADNSPFRPRDGADIVVFPAMLDIHTCVEKFLMTGAQCGRPELTGAFTGDVGMHLLAQHGCRYVLCGHSERRMHHGETDEQIALQVAAAVKAGLMPILCVGETADERETGKAEEVVRRQLAAFGETGAIIAYEPVWAIGTGKTASAQDAQDMHAFIRSVLPAGMSDGTRILYGGSVKPANAAELIPQPDIDGFLVGGASLDPSSFSAIIDSCLSS